MRSKIWSRFFALALLAGAMLVPAQLAAVRFERQDLFGIHTAVVAGALSPYAERNEFPTRLDIKTTNNRFAVDVHYSFIPHMQTALRDLYQRYQPDYGTFVAMDVDNGAIVTMLSFIKDGSDQGNLALRSDYPAASIFKIVTAAAAFDLHKATPETIVPYNGRRSTLYKRQVLRHEDNKWTRRPTLQVAFAESINPVFGRVGVFQVGAVELKNYASRFGFNAQLPADLILPISNAEIGEEPWHIAEAASGFTKRNTLSPIHAAMIASAVVNDGNMRVPYVVSKMTGPNGVLIYAADPRNEPVMQTEAAWQLRSLMRETVVSGSARNAFKKFYRGPLTDIEVGGKTGSLTGWSPRGRYDWFVGYARLGQRKLAFAALTINKKYWTVKSSFVARKMIEEYFSAPAL